MNTQIKQTNFAGISLVELMVALAIGSFLSIGIVQIFASHRVTTNNTEGVSQMQDNTRYALNLISKQARMAGYTGCVSRSTGGDTDDEADDIDFTNMLNRSDGALYNFQNPINGYDNIGAALPAELAVELANDPAPTEGTDILIMRGASDLSVGIQRQNNSAQFFADNNGSAPNGCPDGSASLSGLCDEDIVIASDCVTAVAFQISNVTEVAGGNALNVVHSQANMSPGNAYSSWGGNSAADVIGTDGEIMKIQTNTYYIGDDDGRPALYRKLDSGTATVIANNVVDMQVVYGEDADNISDYVVDEYKTAADVDDWQKVVSVRVSLLVASENDNIVENQGAEGGQVVGMSLPFNGETYIAEDRRLYRAASVTTVLRNRVD